MASLWEAVMAVPKKKPAVNPSSKKRVEKKAESWFQRKATNAKTLEIPDVLEAIEVGEIVAIEYRSTKYDGRPRIWRHEVTKPRKLFISRDGRVLVVLPGFKITKRGIEG
jgi:hypothetical protein